MVQKASAAQKSVHSDWGAEDISKAKQAYLVTLPHTVEDNSADGQKLVPPGNFTREQVGGFFLAVLAATQGGRLQPLGFKLLSVFLERHNTGEIHYHVALLADRCFRFAPLKRELLRTHGLASHWSCTHDGYASCVAYGYLPSPKKPMEELDPDPWLWAANAAPHPPLAEASRAAVTTKALAKLRERERLQRHGDGKGEKRCREVDIWPIVVEQNIHPGADSAERVMAYAKRCGGPMLVEFCFQHWDRLQAIVEKSWKAQQVEDFVSFHNKSRWQVLQDALSTPCACAGAWTEHARRILRQNDIPTASWCQAVTMALQEGRAKGSLVCHAGLHGNEGKSFLFRPLLKVFGAAGVFVAPPAKSSFPLMGLEKARLAWLDDWRFNEDVVPYAVQLLWFEGAPFIIARPQNQFSGHLRYSKDDPVFITTLQADITQLKGKKFLQQGDVDMMLKRLLVFNFTKPITIAKNIVEGCAHCFANFLVTDSCPPPVAAPSASVNESARGEALNVEDAESWSVADVVAFLAQLSLGHLAPQFEDNGVDGQMLCDLTLEDLTDNLGLKPLQAKKILNRLWG
eukprot:Skav235972  [mRNA]  locus=scaffold592:191605:193317:+ [translate_table: standard]